MANHGDLKRTQQQRQQRTGVALLLATAGVMAASSVSASPLMQAALEGSAAAGARLDAAALAQASDCIPIGEGENCERQTLEQRRRQPMANPAADPSSPASNPGASDGSAADELKQIERGDL